jgi:hypothetical protein
VIWIKYQPPGAKTGRGEYAAGRHAQNICLRTAPADVAHWTMVVLSHGTPLRSSADFCLLPLWFRPGHRAGPGEKVPFGWKARHVEVDFGKDHLGREHRDAGNVAQFSGQVAKGPSSH